MGDKTLRQEHKQMNKQGKIIKQIAAAQAFIDAMITIYGEDFRYARGPATEVAMQRASIVHLQSKLNQEA